MKTKIENHKCSLCIYFDPQKCDFVKATLKEYPDILRKWLRGEIMKNEFSKNCIGRFSNRIEFVEALSDYIKTCVQYEFVHREHPDKWGRYYCHLNDAYNDMSGARDVLEKKLDALLEDVVVFRRKP